MSQWRYIVIDAGMLLVRPFPFAKRFFAQWEAREISRANAQAIALWEAADRRRQEAEEQERHARNTALEQSPNFLRLQDATDKLVSYAWQIKQGGDTSSLLGAAWQVIRDLGYARPDCLAHEAIAPRVVWFFSTLAHAGLKFTTFYEGAALELNHEPDGGWDNYLFDKYGEWRNSWSRPR